MAHYVDNKTFYAELVAYRERVKEAEDNGVEVPRVPEYIGECLYQIATRLSTKPNFINYTYRDEMISDGIENCINYLLNFDPEKSKNPFAYFTQIIYYAFLRRIEKEKKQMYIKHKTFENMMVNGNLSEADVNGDNNYEPNVELTNDYMVEFVQNFEDKLKKKNS